MIDGFLKENDVSKRDSHDIVVGSIQESFGSRSTPNNINATATIEPTACGNTKLILNISIPKKTKRSQFNVSVCNKAQNGVYAPIIYDDMDIERRRGA